ncbi:hypothetical protein N7490_011605 [Penicillium lividum]|nr:hypothetical protein N7490_011605 [Penicillium lividum]
MEVALQPEAMKWSSHYAQAINNWNRADVENSSFLKTLMGVLKEHKDDPHADGNFILATTIANTKGITFKADPKTQVVPAWSQIKDNGNILGNATKAAHFAATLMLLKDGINSDKYTNGNKQPIILYKDISLSKKPSGLTDGEWELLKRAHTWVFRNEDPTERTRKKADQNNIPKYRIVITETSFRTEKTFVPVDWAEITKK